MNRSNRGSGIKVGPLLKGFLGSHPAFAANPIGEWKDFVGEQVARYSSPGSLKNKVLVVVAHDSVWKHHIEQYKELLAEKINAGRPEPIVDKIVIRVGEVHGAEPILNPAHKNLEKIKAKRLVVRRKPKSPVGKLTTEEQLLIKSLSDPELRKIGEKLLKRIPPSKTESETPEKNSGQDYQDQLATIRESTRTAPGKEKMRHLFLILLILSGFISLACSI